MTIVLGRTNEVRRERRQVRRTRSRRVGVRTIQKSRILGGPGSASPCVPTDKKRFQDNIRVYSWPFVIYELSKEGQVYATE